LIHSAQGVISQEQNAVRVSLVKGMAGAVIGLSMGITKAAILDTYSFTLGGYQFPYQGTLTGTFSAIVPVSGIFTLQDIVSFSARLSEGQQPAGGTFTTPKSFFFNPPTATTLSFEAFSDNGEVACMGVAALVAFDQCPRAVPPNGITGSVIFKTQLPNGTGTTTTGSFDIPSVKRYERSRGAGPLHTADGGRRAAGSGHVDTQQAHGYAVGVVPIPRRAKFACVIRNKKAGGRLSAV
jgi:hypothetical protein